MLIKIIYQSLVVIGITVNESIHKVKIILEKILQLEIFLFLITIKPQLLHRFLFLIRNYQYFKSCLLVDGINILYRGRNN